MAVPIYSASANSDLLCEVTACGFTSHYTFYMPEDNGFAFYQCIGMGILSHFAKDYGDIVPYIRDKLCEENWLNLTQVEARWRLDEQKHSNPEFWTDVGKACKTDILKRFHEKRWASIVRNEKVIGKTEAEIYQSLSDYLHIYLTWYEHTSTGFLTHKLCSRHRGTPYMFVSIAEDGPLLHLLYHKDFGLDPRIGFPFYTTMSGDVSEPPELVEGRSNHTDVISQQEVSEYQTQLINELLATLRFVDILSPAALEKQATIRNLYSHCRDCGIDENDMQHFLTRKPTDSQQGNPPEKKPMDPSVTHEIKDCANFPGELIKHGNHQMHKSCLTANLMEQKSKGPVVTYKCPGCTQNLSAKILTQLMPYLEEGVNRPQRFLQSETTPKFRPKGQCSNCNHYCASSLILVYSHGCQICYICCNLQVGDKCLVCQEPLDERDIHTLETFRHATITAAPH